MGSIPISHSDGSIVFAPSLGALILPIFMSKIAESPFEPHLSLIPALVSVSVSFSASVSAY